MEISRASIFEQIDARADFLVLLTQATLKNCSQPGDWLRREVERALDSKRNIVPLMLEGFDFSTPGPAEQLTGRMASLRRYNGLDVPVQYFEAAITRLCDKFLNVPLAAVLHPASPSVHDVADARRRAAIAAPAVKERELAEALRDEQVQAGAVGRAMDDNLAAPPRAEFGWCSATRRPRRATKKKAEQMAGCGKDCVEATRDCVRAHRQGAAGQANSSSRH